MIGSKKILIGITGSIAAYKIAVLVRLLVKAGHDVKCIMTPAAEEFISTLTIATLTKHKVDSTLFTNEGWNNHIELALWADVFLIAPATANSIAKMAHGQSDNLVIATYLSAKCPVCIAPAMDLDMWHHPSTQQNINRLLSFGNEIIDVEHGELASGLIGEGRMAEPENILAFLHRKFAQNQDLSGKTILITAGPTYEHLDPVRFIGNYSSGKMGIAIANEAAARGGIVHLVLGPSQYTPIPSVQVTKITSAQQMYEACLEKFDSVDVAIFSAAVADYRPTMIANEKIKKNDSTLELILEKNIDIAYTLGKLKKENQILVGFALETTNEIQHAKEKIHKKNLDFIVLNSLNDKGAGFGHETNKITIIDKNGKQMVHALKTKKEVAKDIIDEISTLFLQ